jgi:PAS domain-containing protein
MAWRIHDSVIRGEIDNRMKGRIRGKLWLDGLDEPVKLDLVGNACPDLAGCLLKFRNPAKTFPMRKKPEFNPLQRGKIGNLSASQKVRVFTIPDEKAFEMIDRGEKPPECTANALYLEWFSEGNGRVVIESAGYELTISAPEWRLTPAEEQQRARDAEAGWAMFAKQLNEALEKQKRGQKDPEAEWNEHDYERLMKESDARTDKYMELQEKYGNSPEAEEKIAKEMGWLRELTEQEAEAEQQRIEEMNRACEEALNEPPPEPEPHREGIDWIRTEDGDIRHPLQHRCFESAMKVWHECDDLNLTESGDEDLQQFIFEFQTTGVKLGGALDGLAQGRDYRDDAFTVAYLKRALDHLHKSQAGLEAVAPKKLLPDKMIVEARRELFEIREGILKLMDDFRGRQ